MAEAAEAVMAGRIPAFGTGAVGDEENDVLRLLLREGGIHKGRAGQKGKGDRFDLEQIRFLSCRRSQSRIGFTCRINVL